MNWYKYEDLKPENEEGWKKLFEGKPVKQTKVEKIDFNWGGGSPMEELHHNHFALRATTEIEFPEGEYTFRTISDDGIRVFLDDEKIINNFKWHPPQEDLASVKISKGKHKIVIEYFEITGHAQLQLWIYKK
jgi:hypothetical protein